MAKRVVARACQVALLGGLWSCAHATGMHFGLNYALAMTALWAFLEIAIRINPGMLNNPGVDENERSKLMDLDQVAIGQIVAPVCIGAGIAAALFGLAITGLLASTPSLQKDAAVLIVPAGPMMLGIPLYLVMGRLADAARLNRHGRTEGRATGA